LGKTERIKRNVENQALFANLKQLKKEPLLEKRLLAKTSVKVRVLRITDVDEEESKCHGVSVRIDEGPCWNVGSPDDQV